MIADQPLHHHESRINGIRLHFVEAGTGPAILFCHGFPELWYSWRHQLAYFARRGFRAIALDMRGHGVSEAPADLDAYDVLSTVGDVVGLLDHLGIDRAMIVGHDAGTTTAYHTALMRPDRVVGVAGLSVPYIPRGPVGFFDLLRQTAPEEFYMRYFQTPGVAEADLEKDPRESLRRLFYANSGDNPDGPIVMMVPKGETLTNTLPQPEIMPPFLSEADLSVYAEAYSHSGFRGGLNGYRVMDLNWKRTAPWASAPLSMPNCYIGGSKDTVLTMPGMYDAALAMMQVHILDGAGHWLQNERPDAVNHILSKFCQQISHGR